MSDAEFDRGVFEGRVLTKLDALHVNIDRVVERLCIAESRLIAVEKSQYQVRLWAAVIGGIVGLLGGKLVALIPMLTKP